MATLSSGSEYEPIPRYRHTSAPVGNRVLVYSGVTQDYYMTRERLSSVVDVFDPQKKLWEAKQTTGRSPVPGVRATTSASVGDDFFMYGGLRRPGRWVKSLHRLDTKMYRWSELFGSQDEKASTPMAKSSAAMVAYGDNLALFGGYGLPHGPAQPGSSFIRSTGFTNGRGLTNEFHLFHLKQGVWSSPSTTGERPPPCSQHSLTAIDNRRAVLFGGYRGGGYINDVHIIDLQTMEWTQLNKSGGEPWPQERCNHASCCLNYGQKHPQLLVTGGLNNGKILKDSWILDVDTGTWRKVSDIPQPRWSHSTTAINVSPGLTEVTMFGGSSEPSAAYDVEQQPKLAATTVLQFMPKGDSWELSGMVSPAELRQSLSEKVETMKISAQNEVKTDTASSGEK